LIDMALRHRLQPENIVFGAIAFVGAHLLEYATWRQWFDPSGTYSVWFLNSGRAVAFTVAWLFAVSLAGHLFARPQREAIVSKGVNMSIGAIASMTAVLLVVGPGTIFPIVLVLGAAIVAAGTMAGAWVAVIVRHS
jgi:hypothetical protein